MSTPLNNSVVKAFRLLSTFKQVPDGLTLTDAADRAGLTMPTTHRFLRTLLSVGALDQTPAGRYVVGPALRALAESNEKVEAPSLILDHHVRQLAALLRETTHVAVLEGGMIRYVAKAETQRSLKIVTQVGTALEAYCTGVGKVLLAYQSRKLLLRYLGKGDLVALTPRTITEADELMAELERIRKKGYAMDDEEFESGLRCVAAPIWVAGKPIAALSSSAPASRLTDKEVPRFVAATTQRAEMIAAEFEQKGFTRI